MIKQRKPEEQLKTDIYNIYSRFLIEPASDRRQVEFVQIYGVIISWCTDYLGISANEMGVEIYNVVQRLVKTGNSNVPNDETGFIKYLKTALYTAENEYYRSNDTGRVYISRETKRRLKLVKEIISIKESNAGRKLTENERRQCTSEWFGSAEYSELVNLINTGSLDFVSKSNDDEMSNLDFDAKSVFTNKDFAGPQDEYFAKLDTAGIRNALELTFNNMQERSRECCRSLFTVWCIKNSIDFEGLSALLDSEILETHRKDGRNPLQREVYLKYHPGVNKESAEAMASGILKKLFSDIKDVIS